MRKDDFDAQMDDLRLALIAPDLQSEMYAQGRLRCADG
jgi:hypothetical protein